MVYSINYEQTVSNALVKTKMINVSQILRSRKISIRNFKQFKKFIKKFKIIYYRYNNTYYVLDFSHFNYINMYIYLQQINVLYYLRRVKIVGINNDNLTYCKEK